MKLALATQTHAHTHSLSRTHFILASVLLGAGWHISVHKYIHVHTYTRTHAYIHTCTRGGFDVFFSQRFSFPFDFFFCSRVLSVPRHRLCARPCLCVGCFSNVPLHSVRVVCSISGFLLRSIVHVYCRIITMVCSMR